MTVIEEAPAVPKPYATDAAIARQPFQTDEDASLGITGRWLRYTDTWEEATGYLSRENTIDVFHRLSQALNIGDVYVVSSRGYVIGWEDGTWHVTRDTLPDDVSKHRELLREALPKPVYQLPAFNASPDVVRVMCNMIERVREIGSKYGWVSKEYRDASDSLIKAFDSLLRWGGKLWKDSDLGICGNSGGMTFGVLPYQWMPEYAPEGAPKLISWSFHS